MLCMVPHMEKHDGTLQLDVFWWHPDKCGDVDPCWSSYRPLIWNRIGALSVLFPPKKRACSALVMLEDLLRRHCGESFCIKQRWPWQVVRQVCLVLFAPC